MWVDKYKPDRLSDVLGGAKITEDLLKWLK
jgi:hypothetical protein